MCIIIKIIRIIRFFERKIEHIQIMFITNLTNKAFYSYEFLLSISINLSFSANT